MEFKISRNKTNKKYTVEMFNYFIQLFRNELTFTLS